MAKSAKSLEKQTNGADGLPLIDLTFPAERLFEYQWPRDDPSAEFYLLQEQVAEYLGINGVRSFQRKYPSLQRRPVLVEERDYSSTRERSTNSNFLKASQHCAVMTFVS